MGWQYIQRHHHQMRLPQRRGDNRRLELVGQLAVEQEKYFFSNGPAKSS